MLKGLYFTAVVFSFFLSFFFFLISEITERISTKLGQIFTYDCYLKNFVRTLREFAPTGWGQITLFGTDFKLWPNISLQQNMILIIGKKQTFQSTETALHAPKFDELWSRNGWQRLASFCPPTTYIFALGDTASLTAWMLCDRQQANVGNDGTCYLVARAFSLV